MKKLLMIITMLLTVEANAGLITYNFIEDGIIGNTVSRDTQVNNLLSFGVIGKRGIKIAIYDQFNGGSGDTKWYDTPNYLMDSHRNTYGVNDDFTFYFDIRELDNEVVSYTSNDFTSYQHVDTAVRFNISNEYFNGYVDVSNVIQSTSVVVPEPPLMMLMLLAIAYVSMRKRNKQDC